MRKTTGGPRAYFGVLGLQFASSRVVSSSSSSAVSSHTSHTASSETLSISYSPDIVVSRMPSLKNPKYTLPLNLISPSLFADDDAVHDVWSGVGNTWSTL